MRRPAVSVLLLASVLASVTQTKSAGKAKLFCKLTQRYTRRCVSQCTSAAALQLCWPRDDPHAVQPRHVEILLPRLP